MPETTRTRTVTIVNEQGMHLRPAYLFVELANKYSSQVELVKDSQRVDGKSILSIATLGAACGTELVIETSGDDADDALQALAGLVEAGFPANTPPEDGQSPPSG